MRRRWRTRRVLKWVGTVLSGVFALLLSLGVWGIVVDYRHFEVGFFGYPPAYKSCWLGRPRSWQSRMDTFPLPLPILLALVALPTVVLWSTDKPTLPPGACQRCGYDLTGNVSGRCPECGTPIKREVETT